MKLWLGFCVNRICHYAPYLLLLEVIFTPYGIRNLSVQLLVMLSVMGVLDRLLLWFYTYNYCGKFNADNSREYALKILEAKADWYFLPEEGKEYLITSVSKMLEKIGKECREEGEEV